MSKLLSHTIAFLLLACSLSHAQAVPTVLARIEAEPSPGAVDQPWTFQFRAFRYPDEVPSGEWIVGPLTAADVGRTFVANASTASEYLRLEFQPIADLLTNGDPCGPSFVPCDTIEFTRCAFGCGTIGSFEHFVFQNLAQPDVRTEIFVPLFSGFDLSGYEIDALLMTINDLSRYTIEIVGRRLESIDVDIDIKPGSIPNSISLGAKGVTPVAILTTDVFDATTVEASSVCFGDAESPSERACSEAHSTGHIQDVDGDGDLDFVLHFETQVLGIDQGDTTACLTGRTSSGTLIRGCDSVRTVPLRSQSRLRRTRVA